MYNIEEFGALPKEAQIAALSDHGQHLLRIGTTAYFIYSNFFVEVEYGIPEDAIERVLPFKDSPKVVELLRVLEAQ